VEKLLNLNQKITDEEFELTAPAGVEIQKLP
jgi:outer membrane lipoprotein-sorting protein